MQQFAHTHLFLKKHIGLLFFLLYAVLGIFTFDVYGISWDELYQREIGLKSWNYIFSSDNSLLTFEMRDYGVGFELPLIAIEKILGLQTDTSIFLMRHLVSHLFFLTGALYIFRLTRLIYSDTFLSVIAFLMYVLHPLIYGHSFFNTKDVPFLSLFTLCFYFAAKAFQTKTIGNYFLLGIFLGVLINIRIMGSLLWMSVIGWMLLDALKEKNYWFQFKRICILSITSIVFLILTWPYLWNDPIGHYVEVFKNMANFRWENTLLFKGQQIRGEDISWDYIPTWFSISTPVPFLIAGVFGSVAFLYQVSLSPALLLKNEVLRFNALFLFCCITPVIGVIALHSVLYDGWRHLYFIYPSFILLSVYGIYLIQTRFKVAVYTAMSFSFIYLMVYSITYFPFQHVYFNYFVTRHQENNYVRKNYEMDYWGVSFKQGVERILKSDTSSVLKLRCELLPAQNLFILLKTEDRERLRFVLPNEADYLLTNYRWHPEDFDLDKPKVDSIRVKNYTILDIFKLKQ